MAHVAPAPPPAGRTGRLSDAWALLSAMPAPWTSIAWLSSDPSPPCQARAFFPAGALAADALAAFGAPRGFTTGC